MKTPKELADQHWTWVDAVLRLGLSLVEYLYKTALIHGYKHGYDDAMKEKGGPG